MEEYARSLRALDGVYAEVSGDERYLVRAKSTQHDSWVLSATDLDQGLWEKEVFFEEMLQQKKALSFSNVSWREFVNKLADALRSDSLFASLNEKDQMKLTAWCYHNGRQISYNYTLLPTDAEEAKTKTADMVFDLLAIARRTKQAELEAHELLSQVDARRVLHPHILTSHRVSEAEASSQPSSSLASSQSIQSMSQSSNKPPRREGTPEHVAVANTVPTNAQAKGIKRRPGYSLVNPRVKRWYGEKGARIGNAAPNKIGISNAQNDG